MFLLLLIWFTGTHCNRSKHLKCLLMHAFIKMWQLALPPRWLFTVQSDWLIDKINCSFLIGYYMLQKYNVQKSSIQLTSAQVLFSRSIRLIPAGLIRRPLHWMSALGAKTHAHILPFLLRFTKHHFTPHLYHYIHTDDNDPRGKALYSNHELAIHDSTHKSLVKVTRKTLFYLGCKPTHASVRGCNRSWVRNVQNLLSCLSATHKAFL